MEKVTAGEFLDALQQQGIDPGVLPEGIEFVRDIPYSSISGRGLTLDTYDREGRPGAPRPAAVFIHGGGWKMFDKRRFFGMASYFALQHGFLSACIQYRFSREAPFPAPIQDTKCAVRWLRSRAAELMIDPGRIAVVGDSSGGHLAALAATTGDSPEYDGVGGHGGSSSHVNLAVVLNGALDLIDLANKSGDVQNGLLVDFLGGMLTEIPDTYREASPLYRVRPGTAPMLLLHGTKDTHISWAQSRDMHDKLLGLGVPSEVQIYDGVGHSWFTHAPYFMVVVRRMETFLAKYFELDSSQT